MEEDKKDFKDREIRRKEIVYRIVNAEGRTPQLTAMHIDDADILWILKILEQYPHINTLNLSANSITNTGVELLAENNNLKGLDVTFNSIDDEGMLIFCKSKTLLALKYSSYEIGFDTRYKINNMLERNEYLVHHPEDANAHGLMERVKVFFQKKDGAA